MTNTRKVTDRRTLRFDSLGEAVADARQIAAWESAGELRPLGNWTPGQAIGHVAFWVNAPFDGYPPEASPPWIMRKLMRLMRGRILSKGMMAGVRIPGAPEGTFGVEDLPTGEAVDRLDRAFTRLDEQCPPDPNPLFGEMTHDQWRQLNLRHAELHFSFFRGP